MRRVDASADLPLLRLGTRPSSENFTGDWRTQRPVIDAGRCTGCLICWKFCPEACVGLTAKVPEIGLAHCKGCAVCAAECPAGCIAMVAEAGA